MTDDEAHFYDPAEGHGLAHDPFKAIVAPRPVGWISTVDARGRVNLAPYSFFNAISEAPPLLAFSSSGRKDSLRNVEATGEFVWSLASRPLAQAMVATSAPLAPGEDEMAAAGLAPAPSRRVRPPRVAAAPAAMECKVVQVLTLRGLDGAELDQHLVIGQVVGVHVRREFLTDGAFDTARASPVARCGGLADYAEADRLFTLERPR